MNTVRTLSHNCVTLSYRATELMIDSSQTQNVMCGRHARQNLILQNEINGLRLANQDRVTNIQTLERQNEELKVAINQWKIKLEEKSQTIEEQQNKIKKLERRLAQMKGSTKIQEEILALKSKRAEAEKRIEEEIRAHEAELAKADEELEQCERELKMAEEDSKEE